MLIQTEERTSKYVEDQLSRFINSIYLKINSIGVWSSRKNTQASYTSNDIELVYYTHGGSVTRIQDKEYKCSVSNLMILPPYGLVTSLNEGYEYYEYIYVHFEVIPASAQARFLELLIHHAQVFQVNEKIGFYLKQMLEEQKQQHLGYQATINALLKQVCVEIIRMQSLERHFLEGSFHYHGTHQLVSQMMAMMNERVYEGLKLNDIALEMGISESYLFKLFKREVGISPSTYLMKRKLIEAKKLLACGLYTISEISDLLGYSSIQHFSMVFKKQEGITPSQYQKQNLKL